MNLQRHQLSTLTSPNLYAPQQINAAFSTAATVCAHTQKKSKKWCKHKNAEAKKPKKKTQKKQLNRKVKQRTKKKPKHVESFYQKNPYSRIEISSQTTFFVWGKKAKPQMKSGAGVGESTFLKNKNIKKRTEREGRIQESDRLILRTRQRTRSQGLYFVAFSLRFHAVSTAGGAARKLCRPSALDQALRCILV